MCVCVCVSGEGPRWVGFWLNTNGIGRMDAEKANCPICFRSCFVRRWQLPLLAQRSRYLFGRRELPSSATRDTDCPYSVPRDLHQPLKDKGSSGRTWFLPHCISFVFHSLFWLFIWNSIVTYTYNWHLNRHFVPDNIITCMKWLYTEFGLNALFIGLCN
jgi:hypothetical protein